MSSPRFTYAPIPTATWDTNAEQAARQVIAGIRDTAETVTGLLNKIVGVLGTTRPDATITVSPGAQTTVTVDGTAVVRVTVEELGLGDRFDITVARIGSTDLPLGNLVLASPAADLLLPAAEQDRIAAAIAAELVHDLITGSTLEIGRGLHDRDATIDAADFQAALDSQTA